MKIQLKTEKEIIKKLKSLDKEVDILMKNPQYGTEQFRSDVQRLTGWAAALFWVIGWENKYGDIFKKIREL